MSSDAENRRQVEAMLSDALDIARREGGVGVEIHLLTADGISCFRWFNLPDDYGLMDMPHVGGAQ